MLPFLYNGTTSALFHCNGIKLCSRLLLKKKRRKVVIHGVIRLIKKGGIISGVRLILSFNDDIAKSISELVTSKSSIRFDEILGIFKGTPLSH